MAYLFREAVVLIESLTHLKPCHKLCNQGTFSFDRVSGQFIYKTEQVRKYRFILLMHNRSFCAIIKQG